MKLLALILCCGLMLSCQSEYPDQPQRLEIISMRYLQEDGVRQELVRVFRDRETQQEVICIGTSGCYLTGRILK